LHRDDVQALLAAIGRQSPPDRVVDTLFSETDGNPFFLEEAVTHFGDEGRLFDESGRWLPGLEVGEDEVPRNVWLLLGQRFARLPEPTRGVLNAAAIIGRVFPYDLLDEVVDESGDEVLDALERAERAHILVPDESAHSLAFSHEMLRQTLLREIPSIRRQRLHLAVADAMARGSGAEEHTATIANHLVLAGIAADPARTIGYL